LFIELCASVDVSRSQFVDVVVDLYVELLLLILDILINSSSRFEEFSIGVHFLTFIVAHNQNVSLQSNRNLEIRPYIKRSSDVVATLDI
jgi:hypothetical protein